MVYSTVDLLAYTWDEEAHVQSVQEVLPRLKEHNFWASLKKCKFHQSSCTYFGHVIDATEAHVDQVKTEGLGKWLKPKLVDWTSVGTKAKGCDIHTDLQSKESTSKGWTLANWLLYHDNQVYALNSGGLQWTVLPVVQNVRKAGPPGRDKTLEVRAAINRLADSFGTGIV